MFSKQETSDLLRAVRRYLNWCYTDLEGEENVVRQKIQRLKDLCVITKYLSPTNNIESRVRVTLGSGKRRYFPWDSNLNIEENHIRGARMALEEPIGAFPQAQLYSLAHASVGYVHFLVG